MQAKKTMSIRLVVTVRGGLIEQDVEAEQSDLSVDRFIYKEWKEQAFAFYSRNWLETVVTSHLFYNEE